MFTATTVCSSTKTDLSRHFSSSLVILAAALPPPRRRRVARQRLLHVRRCTPMAGFAEELTVHTVDYTARAETRNIDPAPSRLQPKQQTQRRRLLLLHHLNSPFFFFFFFAKFFPNSRVARSASELHSWPLAAAALSELYHECSISHSTSISIYLAPQQNGPTHRQGDVRGHFPREVRHPMHRPALSREKGVRGQLWRLQLRRGPRVHRTSSRNAAFLYAHGSWSLRCLRCSSSPSSSTFARTGCGA